MAKSGSKKSENDKTSEKQNKNQTQKANSNKKSGQSKKRKSSELDNETADNNSSHSKTQSNKKQGTKNQIEPESEAEDNDPSSFFRKKTKKRKWQKTKKKKTTENEETEDNDSTKTSTTCSICGLGQAEKPCFEVPSGYLDSFVKCRCHNPLLIHPICLPLIMVLSEFCVLLGKEELDIYCKNCAQESTPTKFILPQYFDSTPKIKKKIPRITAAVEKRNQSDLMKELQTIEKAVHIVHGEVTKANVARSTAKPIFTVPEFEKIFLSKLFYIERSLDADTYIPYHYSTAPANTGERRRIKNYIDSKRSNWKKEIKTAAVQFKSELVNLNPEELQYSKKLLKDAGLDKKDYQIKKIPNQDQEKTIFENVWGKSFTLDHQDLLLIQRIGTTNPITVKNKSSIAELDQITIYTRTNKPANVAPEEQHEELESESESEE